MWLWYNQITGVNKGIEQWRGDNIKVVWQKIMSTSIVILLKLQMGIRRDMRCACIPGPIENNRVMNS